MEQVLTIPRELTEELDLHKFGIFPGEMCPLIRSVDYRFDPRDQAELDKSRKQIIPYILVKRGDEFFVTYRNSSGGEKRLVNKTSLGIGGHVNFDDLPCGWRREASPSYAAFVNGTIREIKEEISGIEAFQESLPIYFIGCVNDDSTDVGSVHLGIVMVMEVPEGFEVTTKCDSFSGGRFRKLEELDDKKDEDTQNMESWSLLILGRSDELMEAIDRAKKFHPALLV